MAVLCEPEERYVFRTNDVGQAQQFLSANGFAFDVALPERNVLDLFIDSEDLQRTSVLYMQRGAAAALTRTEGESSCGDYWIVLPIRDCMQAEMSGRQSELSPRRGFVSTPGQTFTIRTIGRGANFNIGFPEDLIRTRLQALLGELPQGTIEFESEIDLSNDIGNGLARHVRHLMGNFLDGRAVFADAVVAASLEDAIACELLQRHPHNYSSRLVRLDRALPLGDVRRALEFIDANLESAITIEDLVLATGLPGRTLFRHFQDVRGVSPLRYIRDLRFERARQALQKAGPEGSVTEIALRHGLSHLGRFAVEYRKRFGESPSETLQDAALARTPC